MKQFLFLLLLLMPYVSLGQDFYLNNDVGECIICKKDSVYIKLSNHDAFGSYSLYYGQGLKKISSSCDIPKKIILGSNLIDKCANITNGEEHLSKTRFSLRWHDNAPLVYALVTLYDIYDKKIFVSFSDKDGTVSIDDDLFLRSRRITVDTVGLQLDLTLDKSFAIHRDNFIKCLVSDPFIVMNKNHIRFRKNKSQIVVKYNGEEHLFYRSYDTIHYPLKDYISTR